MTPPRLRFLRAAVAAACIAAAFPALAFEAFTIRDIRVEGVQRTDAGTVFAYLPAKIGERMDADKAARAIKALYATGFYSDVRLEAEGGVLVVAVQERPAIAQIDIEGAKEFSKDNLKDGLKQAGIVEAKIFDRSILDRAEKELKRQYNSRGFYSVDVKITVTPLERNRVALRFDIEEGDITRIADINIIGATAFSEREILRQMQLTTPGWLTWLTKDDQYSKQKLTADLEALRSFYLNRGFLEFSIDATQVSITPDRSKVYIAISVTEGPVYRLGEVRLSGDLVVGEKELRSLISLRPGETFSREKVVDSVKRITDRLGNDGYSFANVNPVPDVDREKRTATFNFLVDPGRRVYVRRVNVVGNAKTQDAIIRRELRQLESSWYSLEKIARSKERLQRTGYFSDVNIETPAVPGSQDQVDITVTVKERNTGALNFGLGYSDADKLTISASVSQSNIFGSGNQLAFQINSGTVNKVYAVSFVNPYWTVDGVSLGVDVFRRDVDTASLSVSTYQTSSKGVGVNFGVPVTEFDTIRVGMTAENTLIRINEFNASPRFLDFVNQFGESTNTLRTNLGYARDTRDSIIYPTKGRLTDVSLELGIPPADLRYYRLSLQQQQLFTPERPGWLTFLLNAEAGYADGYGGKPLPFFKNFYAGGVGSVRGFETASLGPRDLNGDVVGGNRRLVGNLELLVPMPGIKDKSVRLSGFVDTGYTWGPGDRIRLGDLRAAAGFAASWDSPVGPLKFSLSQPIRSEPGDKVERFQFQLGRLF